MLFDTARKQQRNRFCILSNDIIETLKYEKLGDSLSEYFRVSDKVEE